MNQKDYKEIAGIIKNRVSNIKLSKEYSDKIKRYLLSELENVANHLADYFEREAWKEAEEKASRTQGMIDANFMNFNKQQFLKDCGVE